MIKNFLLFCLSFRIQVLVAQEAASQSDLSQKCSNPNPAKKFNFFKFYKENSVAILHFFITILVLVAIYVALNVNKIANGLNQEINSMSKMSDENKSQFLSSIAAACVKEAMPMLEKVLKESLAADPNLTAEDKARAKEENNKLIISVVTACAPNLVPMLEKVLKEILAADPNLSEEDRAKAKEENNKLIISALTACMPNLVPMLEKVLKESLAADPNLSEEDRARAKEENNKLIISAVTACMSNLVPMLEKVLKESLAADPNLSEEDKAKAEKSKQELITICVTAFGNSCAASALKYFNSRIEEREEIRRDAMQNFRTEDIYN